MVKGYWQEHCTVEHLNVDSLRSGHNQDTSFCPNAIVLFHPWNQDTSLIRIFFLGSKCVRILGFHCNNPTQSLCYIGSHDPFLLACYQLTFLAIFGFPLLATILGTYSFSTPSLSNLIGLQSCPNRPPSDGDTWYIATQPVVHSL